MINFGNDCLVDTGVDIKMVDIDKKVVQLLRNEIADTSLDVFLLLLLLLGVIRVLRRKHLLGQQLVVVLLRVLAPVHRHQPGLFASASSAVADCPSVADYNWESISSVSTAATIVTSTHLTYLYFFFTFFPFGLCEENRKI